MPLLRGSARSELSKKIWRRRKREGGKGTCAFCHKSIFTGGVRYRGLPYHKTCLGFAMRGLRPEQLANPQLSSITDINPLSEEQLLLLSKRFKVGRILTEPISRQKAMVLGPLAPRGWFMAQYLHKPIKEIAYFGWFLKPSEHEKIMGLRTGNPRARTAWRYYGATPMNPRPPARWWSEWFPKIRAAYPGASGERAARITAGIWWDFPESTRKMLIKRYE